MKKRLISFLCLVLLLFSACSPSGHTPVLNPSADTGIPSRSPEDMDTFSTAVPDYEGSQTTTDIVYLFEMDLKRAYTLLLGNYIGIRQCTAEHNGTPYSYSEFGFTVEQVYMGTFKEKEIWMRVTESALNAAGELHKGQSYFFPVNYEAMIFMPEKQYSANFLIPIQQDGSMEPYHMEKMKTELTFHQLDELLDYCSKTVDLSKNGPIQGWEYTLSEDIQEIMQNAPCVFIGYFTDLEDTPNKSHMKGFSVTLFLKGDIPENVYIRNSEKDFPTFSVWKNYEIEKVVNDKFYILACSFSGSDHATCYVFARENAVVPLEDTERVQQVYDALGISPEP